MKKLSKEQMKMVVGGDDVLSPTVGDDQGPASLGKCCWTGTDNCSACAAGTSCVTGATFKSC